ncbi:MAG: T9SS type A sorting domain-containing protein [Bacteroidales bacterium]|nr:T9SS type A sorting domain-containing protein [Bacteroidales bacterium]
MGQGENSNDLKSGNAIYSSMPQFIPKSQGEFGNRKMELAAMLPKIDQEKDDFDFFGEQKGALLQNIPNPAHGTTSIKYGLSLDADATIVIYNLLGQSMKTIPLGARPAGSYQTEISLSSLPPGTYLYALFVNGERTNTKKMMVN